METELGTRLAQAIAGKDAAGLRSVLDPKVDFRGLTPGRFWEATSAGEVVDDIILGQWFEPGDRVDGIEAIDVDIVEDRHKVTYRFHLTNDGGAYLVEQLAYFDVQDGRISLLRIICSGFRPTAPAS